MGKFWAEKAPREYNQSWNERLLDVIRGLRTTTEKQASEIATVKSDTASLNTTVSSIPTTPSGTPGIPPGKIVAKPSGLTYSIVDVPDPAISGASIPKTVRWILIEWNKNYDRDFKEFEYELYAPYDTTVNIIVGKRGQTQDSLTVARLMVNTIPLNTNFKVRVRTVLQSGDKSEWTLGGKWTTEAHWTTGYDTAGPAAPTSAVATAGIRNIVVTWTNPSTSDFHQTKVYLNVANSFAGATQLSSKGGIGAICTVTLTGTSAYAITVGTPYYVFLQASDNTGNVQTGSPAYTVPTGSPVTPVSTVSTIGAAEITSGLLTKANQAITTNIAFSSTGVTNLTWATGQLLFADGTNVTILSGSYTIIGSGYAYIYYNGTTTLQATETYSVVTGDTNTLLCVGKKGSANDTQAFYIPAVGMVNIIAESIKVNKLEAITTTTGNLTVNSGDGITVTSGGNILLEDGGDIFLDSTGASTKARLVFRESNTERFEIYEGYVASPVEYILYTFPKQTAGNYLTYGGNPNAFAQVQFNLQSSGNPSFSIKPFDHNLFVVEHDGGIGIFNSSNVNTWSVSPSGVMQLIGQTSPAKYTNIQGSASQTVDITLTLPTTAPALNEVLKCTTAAGGILDWVAESASDEKAKVSANDTTAGYLNGKLLAGSDIAFVEGNDGGDETLTIKVVAAGSTNYFQFKSADGSLDASSNFYYDPFGPLFVVLSNAKFGASSANRVNFVAGNSGTAPGTASPSGLWAAQTLYGANTYILGTPAEWLTIQVNGTTRVVPCYTPA